MTAVFFTRSQIESILFLAGEPWRTFFIVLTLTGLRAGEALGLQWSDIDFDHKCIHVRRSAWYGKAQSTKSKASAAPVTLPHALAVVSLNLDRESGWLFATRNNRPPSSNKVVEYRLWPILDALDIPRRGLHAFRDSVGLSSWTLATRRKSQNNSSDIPTLARWSTTSICEAESPNRRWRTFQFP